MELSTIIVTWNSARFIGGCLDSTIQEVREIESEIIVVDNHSADDTVKIIERKYPKVRLIENGENVGFGAANNEGIRLSTGDFILLLNPDTIVHPGAIREMLRFIVNNPQIAMVGPEQVNGRGHANLDFSKFTPRGIVEYVLEWLAPDSRLALKLRTPYTVACLNGGCWLLRREALETCDLYDEEMFLYGEEPDVCKRITKAGWKLAFLRNVTITHFREGSIEQIGWKKYSYVLKSFSRLLMKLLPIEQLILAFRLRFASVPRIRPRHHF